MLQSEWENNMGIKILELTKSEIYLDLPHLLMALNALDFKSDYNIMTSATDGALFYFNPEKMIYLFKKNPVFLTRCYLHSILHCLYSHLWIRNDRMAYIWNIACDIAVEYTLDHLGVPCTSRVLSFQRIELYKTISNFSASGIYDYLIGLDDLEEIAKEFYVDDHVYWPKLEKGQSPSSAASSWQKISRQTSLSKKIKGNENDEGDSILLRNIEASKTQIDYASFLKKFSIVQEEMMIDPDEFDLGYYTFGLNLYSNMPLIEPIETKEVKKIKEFVIVLDTSYSTQQTLIQRFLQETYTILSSQDSYFHKTQIRILQCDEQVRADHVITSKEEMEQLLASFQMIGGGNTDFRPAFAYVDALLQKQELHDLGGLLYFTDGLGIYPKRCPKYKTAFIYCSDYDASKVPPWAIAIRLNEREILYEH